VTTIEGLATDAGLHPSSRPSMRTMRSSAAVHTRLRDGVGLAAEGEPQPVGGGDPPRARGQPLPLYGLPQHPQGRAGGGEAGAIPPLDYARAASIDEAIERSGAGLEGPAGGHPCSRCSSSVSRGPRCSSTSDASTTFARARDGDRIAIGALSRHADLALDRSWPRVWPAGPHRRERRRPAGPAPRNDRRRLPPIPPPMWPRSCSHSMRISSPAPRRRADDSRCRLLHGPVRTALGPQAAHRDRRPEVGGRYLKHVRRRRDWATVARRRCA
jgi:hypothetical protein